MKKIRNILSIALVFVMLIGFAPVNVFAEEAGPQGPSPVVTGTENPTGEGEHKDQTNPPAKTEEEQKAEELAKAKEKAVNDIKALAFLSEDVKNAAIAKINDTAVTTTGDVDKIVNDAKTKNTEAEKTAKEEAKKKVDALKNLDENEKKGIKENIGKADSKEAVEKLVKDATEKAPKTGEPDKKEEDKKEDKKEDKDQVKYYIKPITNGRGTVKTNVSESEEGKTITVEATPAYGYVVDSIVVTNFRTDRSVPVNYTHKSYFNDYPYYLRSRWYDDYPYDYDDYIRWCDRNGYSRYDSDNYRIWCRRYGYSYDYDDFRRWHDWDDVYGYRWYNRYNYDYSYYDQAEFTMPESDVTVTVTFTSAPYWYDGYFYDYETGTYRYYYDDDYYYYRNRRNKKSNYYERQAEKDKKEEETKVVEEKKNDTIVTKAVISIGSNMIDKVSNDLHTKRLMDAPAYVKDGRVMLPLRFVAEALGLQVSWIKDNRTVVIQDMLFRVEIPVDTNNITVNGVTTTSDVKPEIVNGRVMLPIANIARALGLVDGRDIVWNAATKEVTLTRTITK